MAVAALLLVPQLGFAQGKPQPVHFQSVDKVEIKGTFYPASRGKAPVVMLLHEFGKNRQQSGWNELALRLQKEGYAVLSFDFRGHNDSTGVEQEFWRLPINARTFRPNRDRDQITYKDIARNAAYYPMLIQDIAAAKRYLDQRNDAGDCNTSNVIVIGAQESAALGSLWISSEFARPHLIPHPTNPALFGPVIDPERRVEGLDIKAAVWLSMPERLRNIPTRTWLNSAEIRDKVPMAFIYGDQDRGSAAAAKSLHAMLSKNSATRTRAKKTKEKGDELLGKKALNTEEDIVSYLKTVIEKTGNDAWFRRDQIKLPAQLVQIKLFGIP